MNANELANKLMGWADDVYGGGETLIEAATMLRQQQAELDAFKLQYYNTGYSIQLRDKDETIRQQQAEIAALKKTCFDEITKRVYADQTTKVIEGYWEEAQAEIAALKERMRPCQPLCKPSVCDCRPLNQAYDPKKHGAEE